MISVSLATGWMIAIHGPIPPQLSSLSFQPSVREFNGFAIVNTNLYDFMILFIHLFIYLNTFTRQLLLHCFPSLKETLLSWFLWSQRWKKGVVGPSVAVIIRLFISYVYNSRNFVVGNGICRRHQPTQTPHHVHVWMRATSFSRHCLLLMERRSSC